MEADPTRTYLGTGPGPKLDARALGRAAAAQAMIERLTPRQQQVLQLMAAGLLNKQIGAELGLSEKTVKMHRAMLIGGLGAQSSADAVRIHVEASFLAPDYASGYNRPVQCAVRRRVVTVTRRTAA